MSKKKIKVPKAKIPEKAYKDIEFLNSPDAHVVRILAEYLEPLSRFRRLRIRDTIVFFGSARNISMKNAKDVWKRAKSRLGEVSKKKSNSRQLVKLADELNKAEAGLEMARYYEDAIKLSEMLTRWSKKISNGNGQRFVVCSGGGPGIMQAANEGAIRAAAFRSD